MNSHVPRRRRLAAITAAAAVATSLCIATPALAAPSAQPISPAASATTSPGTSVSLDLGGTWKFAKGDDPSYAAPDFDDSSWQDITVPGDGTPFDDYDGFGWYRLTFTLPPDAAGTNLVASLGFLDDVDEAYLNGTRIGGSGTMPPAASSQWFEKRLYPVPADAPNFGGENTLAVRLYDMNGGGGWYEGPVGIYSKDAVRANVYGITGPRASAAQSAAVADVLEAQKTALAAGDVDAYLKTLDKSYFHDGRSKDRRARELRDWMKESGSLTLTDSEVEVVTGEDGALVVDTNRTITGTRDGEPYTFQPASQQFLHIDGTTLRETGNDSRFFRETVDSDLEGQPREFATYLPPSYLSEPNREYPVVYLLHGINGGSREWEPRDIDDVLDGLWKQGLAESIVIMPDGESLWYSDQPNGGTPWRSMFLTEMVPLVDKEYRTLEGRDFRALTGVSMGGFGAWSLGLSNPGMFSSIASHIGSLSYSGSALPTPLKQAGDMTAKQLKKFDLYFDACEFDEYRFDDAARSMNTILTDKGVPHTWAVYPEGRHNDACWMPHLKDSFGMHSTHFREAGLREDFVKPEISVPASTTVSFGSTFDALAGVTARDAVDGDLTAELSVRGTVDTKKLGTYTLRYVVKDAAGNRARVDRTVTVAPAALTVGTPTVSGTAKVGATLTAKPGTWTKGTAFAYQWMRDGSPIRGAVTSTHRLTAADAGTRISVRVTGTQSGYTTAAKTSAATAKVAKGTLRASTPTVTGSAKVGKTLTARAGAWTEGTRLSYQWLNNGRAIAGATKASYSVARGDRGDRLSVRITGSLSGYDTVSRTSGAVRIAR
ncbi:enterochelin esterase-like enzyme [Microbacterium sp. SORGH_AS 505]|uniref:alpha/beta hydrolase-fold protein n=1 Tax=Microbacterium sp. SORGH_AS_0505 TaxID=3041770 RepID=UPI002785B9A3|nr:alpha/beta hydrolase-fold protein [Microbacterium sp. SORGH_AS_0505]MDQ1126411.1 enterochelin esterase-like enzyme [Microbacterium sp. SORGH_AS_0505]